MPTQSGWIPCILPIMALASVADGQRHAPAADVILRDAHGIHLARYRQAERAQMRLVSDSLLIRSADEDIPVGRVDDASLSPNGEYIALSFNDTPSRGGQSSPQTLLVIGISSRKVVYRRQNVERFDGNWYRWIGEQRLEYVRARAGSRPDYPMELELASVSGPAWTAGNEPVLRRIGISIEDVLPTPPGDIAKLRAAAELLHDRTRGRYIALSQTGIYPWYALDGQYGAVSEDDQIIAAKVTDRHSFRQAVIALDAGDGWHVHELLADARQARVDRVWICVGLVVVRIQNHGLGDQLIMFPFPDGAGPTTVEGECVVRSAPRDR